MGPFLFTLILNCQARDHVDEIMAKVAANLEQGSELRKSYVYTQKVHTRLLRTNSKVAREEKREYHVVPGGDSSEKKLVHFEGVYEKDKRLHPYSDKDFRHKGMDLDGELIEDFADDLVADDQSKDGIDMGLFPFLPKDLPNYRFKLIGTETFRNRPVHRISFEGITKNHLWSGEALVDVEDLHPLSIQTKLNLKIPFIVKAILGINIRQTGFSLTYARVAPGVWFPASYGTELRLDLFFGYRRVIAMSMESTNFQKVAADSSITFSPH